MSEETKKVLEMVAEGKISASDGERILEKLAASAQTASREESEGAPKTTTKTKARFLRIVVDKPGQDQINVRMPLSFAGTRLLAVLPSRVSEKLSELGIDLSALASTKGWPPDLEEAEINVDKGDGKKVRIFCE